MVAGLALSPVVTGLYMAWPRDGRGFRHMFVPEFSAKGRVLWKFLHLTLGGWASGLLILFLISGLSWAGIWGGKFVQA